MYIRPDVIEWLLLTGTINVGDVVHVTNGLYQISTASPRTERPKSEGWVRAKFFRANAEIPLAAFEGTQAEFAKHVEPAPDATAAARYAPLPKPKKDIRRDGHGQPKTPFPAALISNHGKIVDQLIGVCQGILMDGAITDGEAQGFRDWVNIHAQIEPGFPFNELVKRLDVIFKDGKLDADEREDLRAIMQSLGGLSGEQVAEIATTSITLPIDDPAPEITYAGAEFVITGRCAFGTRAAVSDKILRRGGTTHDTPRQSTRYLLIGHFASRDWLHTSYGLKIERAVELRKQGTGLKIIAEDHWRKSMTQK